MTETTTKNAVCKHCGADVREGSIFCYNCGKSVTDAQAFNGRPADPEIKRLEKAADSAERQPIAAPGKKLRSAADLERKRAFNRQPVEVVWTPRNDGANSFVVTGVILFVITVVLIVAALYYR